MNMMCGILDLIALYISGDLNISVSVLYNYLEANSKVPWEDLRYLFGEIMYGGHITDDWDRRLCITYLEEFMQPDLVRLICHSYTESGSRHLRWPIYMRSRIPKLVFRHAY